MARGRIDEGRQTARQRIDVKKAAQILGISTDAVHKRAKRGSLLSDKDPDGRVFVYLDDVLDNGYTRLDDDLDDGYTRPDNVYVPPDIHDELLKELRDRVHYLEEESRRKDSIILTLAQRVPELEAAPGASENEPQRRRERVPWWRRFFDL